MADLTASSPSLDVGPLDSSRTAGGTAAFRKQSGGFSAHGHLPSHPLLDICTGEKETHPTKSHTRIIERRFIPNSKPTNSHMLTQQDGQSSTG
jgi:hypothetical protein